MAGRTDRPGGNGTQASDAPRPKPGEGVLAAEAISDTYLRLAQEAAGFGVYDCDVVDNVYHWDDRMRSFWGMEPAAALDYDAIMDAIHPDDRARTLAAWDSALDPDGSGTFACEYRVTDRRDGTLRWIAATGKALFVDGRAVRLLGAAQDVTERKWLEEVLRRSARIDAFRVTLADTLRPLSDPVAIQAAATRMLGNHLQTNRTLYAELTDGGTRARISADYCSGAASIVGHHRLEAYGPTVLGELQAGRTLVVDDAESDPRLAADERAAWTALAVHAGVFVPLFKEGEPRAWLAVHQNRPRPWTDDEIQLVEEVAERTWAAVERAAAESALREADRRKDVFLATLAHELRTPLAAISAAIGVVRSDSDEAMLRPQLDLVDRQLAQLVHLVDDLLDVGRITRGAIDLRREPVSLADVLAQAIESARPALDQEGHDFAVELRDAELVVDGDRLRLAQVFQNLLTNAAKYTPPGGRICVRAQRSGSEAVVSVIDDGIGIAPEHLSQLFEMFARPAHTKSAHDGLGIGLALARSLVGMHGGSIAARSDGPGRGSEFVVRLPLAPEAAAADVTRLPDATAAAAPLRSRTPRRVLIADDNADVGNALATFLRVAGNEVELARDGVEAVEIAARFRPEVAFLDIDMPRLDGTEACRRIREQPWGRDMVILAFTGWSEADNPARTADAGFDRHLVKPVLPAALLALLDAADSVRRR